MADFASVGDLETFMGTTGLGARGTAMLGYASAQIRLYLDQDVEAVTGRQEEFAGDWNQTVIQVTQVPVTAATITIDAVAFTEFWANYVTGEFYRTDFGVWDTGPIVVTYDSGWASTTDEFLGVKAVCLEVAARAISGPTGDTYGFEAQELRGTSPAIFLTDAEMRKLDKLGRVPVG